MNHNVRFCLDETRVEMLLDDLENKKRVLVTILESRQNPGSFWVISKKGQPTDDTLLPKPRVQKLGRE